MKLISNNQVIIVKIIHFIYFWKPYDDSKCFNLHMIHEIPIFDRKKIIIIKLELKLLLILFSRF